MADKISQTVDAAIKRSYAKLARKHFQRAEECIGLVDSGSIGREADARMQWVETYLRKAGAAATRNNF